MTIRRRETVDEHARTIFLFFFFFFFPLSFFPLEKITRFGIYIYVCMYRDRIPGAGLSGGRVQETRNRRSPSDGEWGIIARLRSLREEDSMAASTTPGSNYRISPPFPLPSPSYSLTSNPRYTFLRPFISLRLDVLLFGVCTYRLGEHLSLSLSLSRAIGLDQKPA